MVENMNKIGYLESMVTDLTDRVHVQKDMEQNTNKIQKLSGVIKNLASMKQRFKLSENVKLVQQNVVVDIEK